MRILVTEVTGALGRALARSLLASGHDVSGIAEGGHRDLDSEVSFTCAGLDHPVVRALAADADVVVQLPSSGPPRQADVVRVGDAAARGGSRLVFPSLSLLAPSPWRQAEELVTSGWAPSLVVRIAAPVGRRVDALVARTVAGLLDAPVSGPQHVLHVDDLVRFLVTAVEVEHTGAVDLGTADVIDAAAARHVLLGAEPRRGTRGIRPWPRPVSTPDLVPLQRDWGFECGWSALDAVADTARGLAGRKLEAGGAVAVPNRFPMPVEDPGSRAADPARAPLAGAAPEGAEGEFDSRIDPRFPVFVAAGFGDTGPLTPMSMEVHLTGLRMAARAGSRLLNLPPAVGTEWDTRLVASFGHRIYLGASVLAAAQPRLPARAGALAASLRAAAGDTDPLPAGRPKAGPANPVTVALTSARIAAATRMFRRHLAAYGAAAEAEHLDSHSLSGLTDAALGARIRLVRNRIQQGWMLSGLAVLFAEVAPTQVEAGTADASDAGGTVGRMHAELASLANVITAHPYARISIDGGDLDAARAAAPMFATAFDAAVTRIGHRGPGDIDLAAPVFADRPEAVLAAAGRVTRAPQADDTVTGAAAARELAYDATLRFTHELRSAVRELGTRLAGQEKLAAAEDIFYLTTEEALVMPVDARLRIKRRAAERERLQALVLPPVINGRWEPMPGHRPADNGELRGRVVSRGVAEGTVRVLGSVDDADLTSGEIAVLAAADLDCAILAGTPAAVVADSGRGAADPVVVARHLGVPFVVDVPGATARLVTGMRVRVDGTSGTVTVLADATEEEVAAVPGATLAQ